MWTWWTGLRDRKIAASLKLVGQALEVEHPAGFRDRKIAASLNRHRPSAPTPPLSRFRDRKTPTGFSGIYQSWNADLWHFGMASQYPALKANVDGDKGRRRGRS